MLMLHRAGQQEREYVVLKGISDVTLYQKGWPTCSNTLRGATVWQFFPGLDSEQVGKAPCYQMLARLLHMPGVWIGTMGTEVVSPRAETVARETVRRGVEVGTSWRWPAPTFSAMTRPLTRVVRYSLSAHSLRRDSTAL